MLNLYLLSAISCIITFLLFIPFIDLLYRLKIQDPFRKKGRKDRFGQFVNIFDSIKGHKVGTPTGGGILLVLVVLILFLLVFMYRVQEMSLNMFLLLVLTILLFGVVGFYDDLVKVFKFTGLCLRVRYKMLVQLSVGAIVAYWGVTNNLFFVKIPFLNFTLTSGFLLFGLAVLTVVFMSNAFNIIDGIDGLSSGTLLITLLTLGFFVSYKFNSVTESALIAISFGAFLAYLYFNINPARLFMGDTGALAFGALIGVLTLTTGTLYLLPIFGLVFIVDALSSIVQWTSIYFRKGQKVFKIAPLHHHFEAVGWEGTKVVFRFWVIHAFLSLLSVGIFVSLG